MLLSSLATSCSAHLVVLYREALSSATVLYSSLHPPLPTILPDVNEHFFMKYLYRAIEHKWMDELPLL